MPKDGGLELIDVAIQDGIPAAKWEVQRLEGSAPWQILFQHRVLSAHHSGRVQGSFRLAISSCHLTSFRYLDPSFFKASGPLPSSNAVAISRPLQEFRGLSNFAIHLVTSPLSSIWIPHFSKHLDHFQRCCRSGPLAVGGQYGRLGFSLLSHLELEGLGFLYDGIALLPVS
jgi:hypothetical protein